jgi:hypothetical protein
MAPNSLFPTPSKNATKNFDWPKPKYKNARESVTARLQEMEDRMTDLYLSASTSNKDKFEILKHIKKAEEIKRMFRKLAYQLSICSKSPATR